MNGSPKESKQDQDLRAIKLTEDWTDPRFSQIFGTFLSLVRSDLSLSPICPVTMLKEKHLSNDAVCGGDNSPSKVKEHSSDQDLEYPDENIQFSEKGIDFLGNLGTGRDGFQPKSGNSGSQELTLSHLCDNSKLGFPEKEVSGKKFLNSFDKVNYKGKEVVSVDQNQEDSIWVERDFLQLKREIEHEEIKRENKEKKPKVETLNLSLALSDVSLSLAQNVDPPPQLKPSRSVQSLAPSNYNTLTTYSNDFSAASLSHSYSHPFSHNPSCSMTRNSTENYEYSAGSHRRECDQIWNCGEGTNGSVHSRFRPIGDGVALSNHGGGGSSLMQANRPLNKDSSNTLYPTMSSDNHSFFPSELPARPEMDTQSGDSRGRGSEHVRGSETLDGERAQKLSRPERILKEIVSESIPVMAQIIQELPDETVESTKEYLKNLIRTPEKRDELVVLQNLLERRSDLTKESLSKSHKNQLEILIAIKMCLRSFLSGEVCLPTTELVEIFLLERCRNVNCKRLLPVDDCDCKICSTKKGFCSECMCPVCLNFDCANNTCSWVGCDVCSHWCHTACGIQRNLIKTGPSLKEPSGFTELHFHCLGCGHASEMFGFVKDVFMSCAKEWGLETLIKELDCVRKIFQGSEDFRGKELHKKADDMLCKLNNRLMSPSKVCNFIFQFFIYTDGMSDFPASSVASEDLTGTQASLRKDATPLPAPNSLPPNSSLYDMSSSSGRRDLFSHDFNQSGLKASLVSSKMAEDEWLVKLSKKDGFDSLEGIVRIKEVEVEVRMFQNRADEARREAEGYRRMVRMKSEKLEEEYAEKLVKVQLCVQETEEQRRNNLEELKILEHSQFDYYKMKMRMQADIAGLLERMEATKQHWV